MKSWPDIYLPQLECLLPSLSLFDSKEEAIRPLPERDIYRIYVCGITPYDATHLGHAATYLTFDLIHRYLRAKGAEVRFVENITDIDDPLLERAARDDVDWQSLATSQIDLFRADMVDLHILPPSHYIGVIESMPEIIDAISEIHSAGATYSLEGDLYCDIRRDRNFGSRSHLSESQARAIFGERGGDPDRPGKRDPLDPLLWRAYRPGEPFWESPFGPGRPGWHIECQAIALAYLGAHNTGALIDIQGGGSDLIFPHHEMSAAQVSLQKNREFADFYIHAGMIGLDGEKMSKSRGNLVFVSKLTAEGVDPMAIRVALLRQHYQADRMWSPEILHHAQNFIEALRLALSKDEVASTHLLVQEIVEDLSRNLDTPRIFERVEKWIDDTRAGATGGSAGELSRALDTLLGIAL